MPFVTEEIYHALTHETCCIAEWPTPIDSADSTTQEEVKRLLSAITTVREIKNSYNLKPSTPVNVALYQLDQTPIEQNALLSATLEKMAKATWCETLEGETLVRPIHNGTLQIPMGEIVNEEEEKAKLMKEQQRLMQEIKRAEGMLSNQNFVSKAPPAKIEEEKKKYENYKAQLAIVSERLKQF